MLKPIDTATRETKSLNGLWKFAPDTPFTSAPISSSAAASDTEFWKAPLPGTRECPVPASYNDLFLEPSLRNHVGKVWYQRTIRIPAGWKDRRIFVRVDAATHQGEVYINDKFVTKHIGGYMPFEADLTDHVKAGEEARLTIAVNNLLTNETIPVGKFVVNDRGVVQQKYWHDFFNYAGLARSVTLNAAPLDRVEDITITTDIEGEAGLVHYKVHTTSGSKDLELELVDQDGKTAGKGSGSSGTIKVAKAHLWQPGAAYLYNLNIKLKKDSALVDEYVLPVGIRTVRVDGLQLLINNKPFYFTGYGRHEDTPVKGKGHDDAWMVHDFELMKWTGANSFRTSHYPYAEDVMDYADRHGWVVIDETPAVGLNLSLGGGIFGKAERTWGEFANDKTQAAHKHIIQELIQRDKNHPCVVMWCITNEPASGEEGAREYFEPLVRLNKELDPSRPVTFTNMGMARPNQDLIADLFDVIGINRYYGWYSDTGDLATAELHLEQELREWQDKFNRPIMMFEYGADTMAGLHSVGELPWSEEYQSDLYEMYHRVFDKIPALIGEQVWNFADFNTGSGIVRVDGNKKGIFTRSRQPKLAAHSLRRRWQGLQKTPHEKISK